LFICFPLFTLFRPSVEISGTYKYAESVAFRESGFSVFVLFWNIYSSNIFIQEISVLIPFCMCAMFCFVLFSGKQTMFWYPFMDTYLKL
jgi:hypothetical protein